MYCWRAVFFKCFRCATMFEGRSDICVPPIVSEQTAERVLTMGFETVSSDGLEAPRKSQADAK